MNRFRFLIVNKRDRKNFLSYLAQNLILVVLIIVSTIPIYNVALETNRQNEINSVTSEFNMAFTEINSLLESLTAESEKLFQDSNIILLSNKRSDLTPQDYIRMRDASVLLSKAIRGKSLLSDIYILNNSNGIFLSNQMVSDNGEKIYSHFYELENYDAAQWQTLIRSGESKYYYLPSIMCKPFTSADSPIRKSYIHFIARSTTLTENANSVYVVYMLDADMIASKFVKEYFKDYAYFSVKDTHGNLLLHYGSSENADSANYEIIQTDSINLDVTLGIEETYFVDRMANIRNMLLLYWVLLVVIAFVLSIILTQRQTKPLRFLMNSLRGIGPSDPAVYAGSDYQYISDTVTHLDTQCRQYAEEIEAMQSSIRGNLIHNVFKGGIYTEEDEDLCKQVLKLGGTAFCTVMMSPQEALPIAETGKINAICVQTISQATGMPVLTYNKSASTTYLLLSLTENTKSQISHVKTMFMELETRLMEEHKKHCFFGIGTVVHGIKNITESTANAKCAVSQCTETQPVKGYSQNTSGAVQLHFLPHQNLQKIKTLILSNLQKDIDSFFAKMNEEFSAQAETNTETAGNVYFSLRNAILEVCGQYVPELLAEVERMPYNGQFVQDLAQLHEFSLVVSQEVQAHREMAGVSLGKKIVAYIAEHYHNPDLYAGMIAEQFSVSEKYVFNLVKAETGKSLGEYIEQVRFQHVEELLLQRVNVNNISQQVGFHSINTFYKAFKRIYGTSPVKWRDAQI